MKNTLLEIMRIGAGDMGALEQDIDEHLSKEEANDRAEEKREQWIEDNIEEEMDKSSSMKMYIEDECDSIHYMKYCRRYLAYLYDSGKRGNHD